LNDVQRSTFNDFDIRVPGTIKLVSRPSNAPSVFSPPPAGYKSVLVRENPYAGPPLDDGRFTFLVPVELGKLPEGSLANDEPDEKSPPVLSVDGTDEILLGVEFKSPDGKTQWATRKVLLAADPFFDITERRGREPLEGVQVGETAYFRVIDPLRDTSDQNDSVSLSVYRQHPAGSRQDGGGTSKTASGATQEVKLSETFTHSGMFKGMAKLVYKGDAEEAKAPDALAVDYGDKVTATYQRPGAPKGIERSLLVFKGGDGRILPFTKRFADPAVAVKTQFTIAEAYFELAKRHRELGQEKMAADEIAQGKRILGEAIQDFPDTEARAQADYLLADLALESANEAKDGETKKKLLMQAVSSFTDIVATYPDSPYAPRSQYKKALAFEKMGQIDQACEEYVKLSYRYPDNELVAETIARLGQYFLAKGKDIRTRVDAQADAVKREKIELQARDMYETAGQVFGRLAVRFPTHKLAGKTSVLSAQCYMQAEDLPKAIAVFKEIAANTKMESDLIAESMYWCGDCYMKQKDFVNAYRMLKKLTWDYPASKWAKFARGRLTEDSLVNAGEKTDK
jgi:outer membrane protein assembly factor BamD (BamD/ComL family)